MPVSSGIHSQPTIPGDWGRYSVYHPAWQWVTTEQQVAKCDLNERFRVTCNDAFTLLYRHTSKVYTEADMFG